MKFENKLFNPGAQEKDALIEHFVVRTKVFERIFKDISSSKMDFPEQHYIIQGQRGMGKTTLLLRLKYEIEKTPALNSWLTPVFFNEETYDVTSLSNLWEKLLKYLDDYWHTGGALYDATEKFLGSANYEKNVFEFLLNTLHERKKKIVLFFDNFGELFLDQLTETEQRRLREILITCNDIRIIAASAVVIEEFNDYKQPFFDFFKIVHLEGLTKDETIQLIEKLQEKSDNKIDIEKNRAKIETLATLTGGVVRTIMLIYEILLNDEDGSALKDLESILDKITPLYKHRMEGLSIQQRKIVDVIAKNWDAVSVKELSERIRENGKLLSSKLISAQLQQLEKNNVIEKISTSTKNNLYILRERFFNIWYLMRNGDRNDRCRVIWLTRFLEMWYSEDGIGIFINQHIKKLKSGKYVPYSAILIADALFQSNNINIADRFKVFYETANALPVEDKIYLLKFKDSLIKQIDSNIKANDYLGVINVIKNISPQTDNYKALIAIGYYQMEDYQNAIEYFDKINDLSTIKMFAIEKLYAISHLKVGNTKKALDSLLEIQSKDQYIYSIIASIYDENKNYELAEKYYRKAIDAGNLIAYLPLIEMYWNETLYDNVVNTSLHAITIEAIKKERIYEILGATYMQLKDWDNGLKYLLLSKNEYGENVPFLVKYLLAIAYLQKNVNKDIAISYANDIVNSDYFKNFKGLTTLVLIYIWANRIEEAVQLISNIKIETEDISNINSALIFLIAKKQYHTALQIFNREDLNLKNLLKPTYYALLDLLKNEYPDEHLKRGKELDQPVKDVLTQINEIAKEYSL